MVEVTLLGPMGELAGTRTTEVEARTVAELLEVLGARYGSEFRKRVRGSRITVNGSPIQFGRGLRTPLKAGDEVGLLVPIGGG
jgi:molybdopterin converting factor small subunit